MTDPFEAPAGPPEPDDAPPRAGAVVILAAIALMIAGLLAAAYALQLLTFIRWYGPGWIGPVVFGALGLGQVVVAALVVRGAAVPTGVGAVSAALQLVLALGWTVYALYLTIFSPLGLCWLLTCLPPLVLLPAALPRAIRITTARRRLYRD
jgi:hypothetical protein